MGNVKIKKNVFAQRHRERREELKDFSVVAKFATTASDFKVEQAVPQLIIEL
jgi:hypothetical protein